MTNNSTHILHNMPTQRKSLLSRRSTGLVIAYRNGTKIMYGENPQMLAAHEYITEDAAMTGLRVLAAIDQSQRVGRVCKDCGHVPAELVVCPATSDGAHRTEMRNVPEIESVDGEPKIVRPN